MAFVSDQYFYSDVQSNNDWLDFDQLLDIPTDCSDIYSASANSVSPELSLPYDAEMVNDLPDMQSAFSDMINYDFLQDNFFADESPMVGLMPDLIPAFDEPAYQNYQPYDMQCDFREMVETQAVTAPGNASLKEKRREAAIALHLQRLCDATALDLEMSSDSNTSFSSPGWSDYMQESVSSQSISASPESNPKSPSTPVNGAGAMEMVLDLNMNATTNLPKKQKPRSQAQKENYIKARKYGACEKHKKQHKRCNCLEVAATRAGTTQLPIITGFTGGLKERSKHPSIQMSVLPAARPAVPGLDSPLKTQLARQKIGSSPLNVSVIPNSGGEVQMRVKGTPQTTQAKTGQQGVPSTIAVHSQAKNVATNGKRIICLPVQETQSSFQLSQAVGRKPIGLSGLRLRSPEESANSPEALLRIVAVNSKKHSPKHSPGSTPPRPSGLHVGSLGAVSVMVPVRLNPSSTAGSRLTGASQNVRTTGLSSTAARCSSTSVSGITRLSQRLPLSARCQDLWETSSAALGLFKDRHDLRSGQISGADYMASSLVQSIGLLAQSTLAVTGVWNSLLSLKCIPQEIFYKCLAFTGRNLMSAKKHSHSWAVGLS